MICLDLICFCQIYCFNCLIRIKTAVPVIIRRSKTVSTLKRKLCRSEKLYFCFAQIPVEALWTISCPIQSVQDRIEIVCPITMTMTMTMTMTITITIMTIKVADLKYTELKPLSRRIAHKFRTVEEFLNGCGL